MLYERRLGKNILRMLYPCTSYLERRLDEINRKNRESAGELSFVCFENIEEIKQSTLAFLAKMRVIRKGVFLGYHYSYSTSSALLYCTLAALLLKHLYGVKDSLTNEELEKVLEYQEEDGLFRDSAIACASAETEDWWGWRHLTLHALMTLAIYGIAVRREIGYLERFADKDKFLTYLHSRDWGDRVAWTSNEIQNLGIMLQYARDYQKSQRSGELLEIMYEVIESKQDAKTGLYGKGFETSEKLSFGVQAGYHFWLLYFYDRRPIPFVDLIIDNILKTQNLAGGYGTRWNSSACEDIDSIDPLVRLSFVRKYRKADIMASLRRALPAILQNINADGGWVFRRHEGMTVVHPQMYSGENESNMFYTWFRTLGLAYCLVGLGTECPEELVYDWQFCRAPGHQLAVGV